MSTANHRNTCFYFTKDFKITENPDNGTLFDLWQAFQRYYSLPHRSTETSLIRGGRRRGGRRRGGRLCFRWRFFETVRFADENGTVGIADNEVTSAFGDCMLQVGILLALSDYHVSSSAFLCFFYDHLTGHSFAGNYGTVQLSANLQNPKGNTSGNYYAPLIA